MTTPDLRDLHRRVLRASAALVSRATEADLERATPCSAWTLRDLLAHMTVQHYGFAAASAGNGGDLAVWEVRTFGPYPVAAYADAVEHVLAAFARDGVLAQPFALPEISATLTFPGAQAIELHFIDYVVHRLGRRPRARRPVRARHGGARGRADRCPTVPEGDRRLVPGAAFKPSLDVPEGRPAPGPHCRDAQPPAELARLTAPEWGAMPGSRPSSATGGAGSAGYRVAARGGRAATLRAVNPVARVRHGRARPDKRLAVRREQRLRLTIRAAIGRTRCWRTRLSDLSGTGSPTSRLTASKRTCATATRWCGRIFSPPRPPSSEYRRRVYVLGPAATRPSASISARAGLPFG